MKCRFQLFFDICWKISLRVWAAILKRSSFCSELVICPCFPPNPYTGMCVSTTGSFALFGTKVKQHGKTSVESWFFGSSLISDFSVHFNYSSRITVGGMGNHFQVLKVYQGTCPFPRRGPPPGPQGVWRYMYGAVYVYVTCWRCSVLYYIEGARNSVILNVPIHTYVYISYIYTYVYYYVCTLYINMYIYIYIFLSF